MKASELLCETSYLHPGEMSRKMLDGGISIGAIKRDYGKLGQIQDLIVYIDNHNTHVIVIDLTSEVITDRFEQVFRIQFKPSNLLKFKNNFTNLIQVDKVSVLRKSGTQGIASTVYKMIVDNGFTLVSDVTQFDPAKALWKNDIWTSGSDMNGIYRVLIMTK